MIGAGALWNGEAPLDRLDYPAPYKPGTPIGEHLRVEQVLRVGEGRLFHLVNNTGPKWKQPKCWKCGNRNNEESSKTCGYCQAPFRPLKFMMTVRWDASSYKPFEAFVRKRVDHVAVLTPVVLYYRDGRMLAVYHYGGERLLLDEPSPIPADRLVKVGRFLCRMLDWLHGNGIIVRSLSPQNLMAMPDGTVRLFDLDVLDVVSPFAIPRHPSRPEELATKTIGTLLGRWVAPENEELATVLEAAAKGAVPNLESLERALENVRAQGGAQSVVASRASAYTDTGLLRSHNEDAWGWREVDDTSHLYAVADGLGGHECGEVASGIAIKTVCEAMNAVPRNADVEKCEKILVEAFKRANVAVREEGRVRRAKIGSTLVAAILQGRNLAVANCGDSRAYVLRTGKLVQLSRDHTVAQDLIEEKRMAPEAARATPHGNVLTSNLGGDDSDLEIHSAKFEARPGDRILLCSDGLWGLVGDERIAEILAANADRRQAIQALVREAYDAGGKDNVTVQIVDVA
jgi:serine/threonine protein phosphatase PrpC